MYVHIIRYVWDVLCPFSLQVAHSVSWLFSSEVSCAAVNYPRNVQRTYLGELNSMRMSNSGDKHTLPPFFRGFLSSEFALHAGYIGVAEENDIIILYPQARSSIVPLNPQGCWDW